MTEVPGVGPIERDPQSVTIKYPRGPEAAGEVINVFLDARGLLASQQRPETGGRRWFRRGPSPRRAPIPQMIGRNVDLANHFDRESTRPEGEPRSIVATVPKVGSDRFGGPDSIVGYLLLGEPMAQEDGTHVLIQDVAVRKGHRNNNVLKSMIDTVLNFRVDGEPVIYDAWAVDHTYAMLSRPAIKARLGEKGYAVVDHEERQRNGEETHHRISLVPIPNK